MQYITKGATQLGMFTIMHNRFASSHQHPKMNLCLMKTPVHSFGIGERWDCRKNHQSVLDAQTGEVVVVIHFEFARYSPPMC